MQMETPATMQELYWAVEDKRDATARLAEARLDLAVAQLGLDAVVADHNALYRERLAMRAAARFERDTAAKDADWEETESRLLSYAEWLEEESRRCDIRYHHACEAAWEAGSAVGDARQNARRWDRALHQMLVAYREGMVVEDGLLEPAPTDDYDYGSYDDCCCPMCRPYLYDDYYDDWAQEDAWDEEERLTLDAERRKLFVRKRKAYKPRARRGRSS